MAEDRECSDWKRIGINEYPLYGRFLLTDTLLYSLNGRFDLKNVESALKSDFNIEQCLLWAHLHGEKVSDTFYCGVTDNDFFHSSNACPVGSLSDEQCPRFAAQE